MHFLYRITNQLNGKIYIGQSNDGQYRWRQHTYLARNPAKTGQRVHYAMAKYGIENFTFEVIATCISQDDANEIEAVLITQYNSLDGNFGYNSKPGAGVAGHSESTKQKLREATIKQIEEKGHPSLGKRRSEEQRAKLSHAQRHNRKNNYTPEMREMFSRVHSGRKHPEETVQKRTAAIAEATKRRQEKELAEGKWKCHAPDCTVNGVRDDYLRYEGLRYCPKHGSRLKRNGTLELIDRVRKENNQL